MSDANLPIALRPAVDFPPLRGSIFDDPGDEKSWHISQRAENLSQYYEGRDPSWYASAIAPLKGADRVLDLGCGPGLALRALRDQGSSTVLGIDRWPAFGAASTDGVPIVAHDLSLPMPFLESASFDGVLSHYALDYVSPICARQILREAHRVLVPGGRLALYLAAVGLAGGDQSRTVAYSPEAVRILLAEAGFEEIEVTASSNGRNTVAKARRSSVEANAVIEPCIAIEGDVQISASFHGTVDALALEISGREHAAAFSIELPHAGLDDDARVSVCARAQRLDDGGIRLQLWVWRGYTPVVAECFRVEFPAKEMQFKVAKTGKPAHVSLWRPAELPLEPPANAHARIDEIPVGSTLSDAERGAEGRQVVVESAGDPPIHFWDPPIHFWDRLGPGRNRFLIRLASRLDLAVLDREWLSARLDGVTVTASELSGDGLRELLLWCGWRQSLLYVNGANWESIHEAMERRCAEMTGPVVLTDPALVASEGLGQALAADVAALVAESNRFFVLLDARSVERSDGADLARVSRRLLLANPDRSPGLDTSEPDEALRYLTERTLLMRLRQSRRFSWAEVGRRPVR